MGIIIIIVYVNGIDYYLDCWTTTSKELGTIAAVLSCDAFLLHSIIYNVFATLQGDEVETRQKTWPQGGKSVVKKKRAAMW